MATHGIRVRAAANTVIAWKPMDWHATSLALVNDSDTAKEYHQRGLAFVTSSRLPGVIEKYRQGLITEEVRDKEALQIHASNADDDENEVIEFVSNLRRSARIAAQKEAAKTS